MEERKKMFVLTEMEENSFYNAHVFTLIPFFILQQNTHFINVLWYFLLLLSIVSLAPFSLNYVLTFKLKTQNIFHNETLCIQSSRKIIEEWGKRKVFSFTTHYTRMDKTEKGNSATRIFFFTMCLLSNESVH